MNKANPKYFVKCTNSKCNHHFYTRETVKNTQCSECKKYFKYSDALVKLQ